MTSVFHTLTQKRKQQKDINKIAESKIVWAKGSAKLWMEPLSSVFSFDRWSKKLKQRGRKKKEDINNLDENHFVHTIQLSPRLPTIHI